MFNASRLKLVRIVFALGILAFGWSVPLVRAMPGWPPAEMPNWARFAPWVLAAWMVASMLLFREAIWKKSSTAQRGQATFSGWAVGSGAALGGGLWYSYTGRPEWYFVGIVIFISSLFLFPIPA
jgi:hypothetical protein